MRQLLLTGLMVVCSVVFQAIGSTVEAGELNVQGRSWLGGSSTLIVGEVNGIVRWSVTGSFNDVASVSLGPTGGHRSIGTLQIRDLATLPARDLAPLVRYSQEKLPDGQTRVIVGVTNAQPEFNGGAVTLRRGSALIDSDQIRLNP